MNIKKFGLIVLVTIFGVFLVSNAISVSCGSGLLGFGCTPDNAPRILPPPVAPSCESEHGPPVFVDSCIFVCEDYAHGVSCTYHQWVFSYDDLTCDRFVGEGCTCYPGEGWGGIITDAQSEGRTCYDHL